MTDLNHLYYREQVSMMLADAAICESDRAMHRDLAESYGYAIHRFRTMRGVETAFVA